jgi:pyruvate/2-oxoglutarate dehydrogenase complex dihydrolipoamide dehydrogenase (E3) component
MPDFDIAVIGAGSAGLSVTAAAAQLGLKVALIERDRMGGDCLNTGCVPSKALLAAAHAAQDARESARLGLHVSPPEIDWRAVRAHVHGVIAAIAPNDSEARFTALGATVLRGSARFVSPDGLSVTLAGGTQRLTARRFVIAAGSRASVPGIPGLADVAYVTHAELFDMAVRPDHLLILGGGPIGLEMAQAHAGLGCQVTIVEAARIAARDDPELVAGLRNCLTAQCIEIVEGAKVARVEGGPALVLEDGRRIVGSHLLVAVGRRPNTEDLGLEAGNIRFGDGGIITDRGLRSTTNRRVFAVGDIADPIGIGPRYFTHVGSYHASIFVRWALFRMPARINYAALPRVTYTAPELAQTGMTEADARAAGHVVRVLRWPLAENDRAQTERRTEGLAKLVVTQSGRVLGAGILAPHAGEMIGAWTLGIARRVPLSALAGMIVPYPTLAEAPKRAAGTFFTSRLFGPPAQRLVKWLTRLP